MEPQEITTKLLPAIRLLAALILLTVAFHATAEATDSPTGEPASPFCEPTPLVGLVCVSDFTIVFSAFCRNWDCCKTCSVWPGRNCDFRGNVQEGYHEGKIGTGTLTAQYSQGASACQT